MYEEEEQQNDFDPGGGGVDVGPAGGASESGVGDVDGGGSADASLTAEPAAPAFDPTFETEVKEPEAPADLGVPGALPGGSEAAMPSATVANPFSEVNALGEQGLWGMPATQPQQVVGGPKDLVDRPSSLLDPELEQKVAQLTGSRGFVNPDLTPDPAAVRGAQESLLGFAREAVANYSQQGYNTPEHYMQVKGNFASDWLASVNALAHGQLAGGFRGMNWEPHQGWGFGRPASGPAAPAAARTVGEAPQPQQRQAPVTALQEPAGVRGGGQLVSFDPSGGGFVDRGLEDVLQRQSMALRSQGGGFDPSGGMFVDQGLTAAELERQKRGRR